MSLSQLLCLLSLVGVALDYFRPLNWHVVWGREVLGSSLCWHSSAPCPCVLPQALAVPLGCRKCRKPNKLICCLKIHKGAEKWDNDPGPAGVVAAVMTSGMGKGWNSCCEILVYVFGLHQKCFPLLFVAKFPVADGDLITQGPVLHSINGIHSAASTVVPTSREK